MDQNFNNKIIDEGCQEKPSLIVTRKRLTEAIFLLTPPPIDGYLRQGAQTPRQLYMSRRNHQHIHSSSEEEAQEDREILEHSEHLPSDEDQGEDLLEDYERDYEPIQELDRYENEGVEEEEAELNPQARRAAEKEMARREKQPEQVIENYLDAQLEMQMAARRAMQKFYDRNDENYDSENEDQMIDAEEQKSSFESWVNLEAVRRYIRHHFVKFLTHFVCEGRLVYHEKIAEMCHLNLQSLEVDFEHFRMANARMAKWLAYSPLQFIPELNAVLYSYACRTYPNYQRLFAESYTKITNLPLCDSIRRLSHEHLNQLIRIKGMVTCRSEVYHQLRKVTYKCVRCGLGKGPYFGSERSKNDLGKCYSCHSLGPFLLDSAKTVYRNFQTVTLQESPADVEPGRIPRSKEIYLLGDNIDRVKPGEEAEVVGVYAVRYECQLNAKMGYPVFTTYVEANNIRPQNQLPSFTSCDTQRFAQLAATPHFALKFYNSIAPSIYGHSKVKRAIALALFGGVSKENALNHRTRGDVNVLLLGDPGIAKSQFLKSVQKVFSRCMYTTGKGASAAGLTACVRKDTQGEWKLEAGALVLSDQGVCLIDEFDKMTEQDRTSIHEAMEQQTISISKAGIVTTLRARCSVIAAANPLSGRYNETLCFRDNINLTDPILSRFDVLLVIKDTCNAAIDARLSEFVINQHLASHPYHALYSLPPVSIGTEHSDSQRFHQDPDFFKAYINFARTTIHPKFSARTSDIVKEFYGRLREGAKETGGMHIGTRHLESMVRLSEAHARMHLRAETNEEDAKVAIRVMLESFIETQKHSTAETLKKKFKYDLTDL